MKILHVCAGWGDTNGAAVIARRIARRQEERGDDVSFAVWASPARLRAADEVWTHCGWLPCLWWAGIFARRLVRMPEACYDPVRLAYHGWKKRLVRPLERFFLRRAASVVATCAAEREWVEAYEPNSKVDVFDLRGIDWGPAVGGIASETGRQAAGRPLRVLYMGRRHPLKGVQYLEAAVRELNEEREGAISLRVVSDARGAEKEDAFGWCDVFCLPTLSENFGIVIAEALARGRPVITTDGSPAWNDEPRTGKDGTPRLVYIEGYRMAPADVRVRMIRDALVRFCDSSRRMQ